MRFTRSAAGRLVSQVGKFLSPDICSYLQAGVQKKYRGVVHLCECPPPPHLLSVSAFHTQFTCTHMHTEQMVEAFATLAGEKSSLQFEDFQSLLLFQHLPTLTLKKQPLNTRWQS